MKNIFKEYNVRQLQNAENFADYIRKKWNFGICDNNILIVIIAADNQIAYSQGSTTEKVFPKFLLDDTIKNNQIHFTNENYYLGLENIITSLKKSLNRKIQFLPNVEEDNVDNEEQPEESETEDSSHTGLIIGAIVGLLIFICLIILLLIYLRRRFSEDGTKFQFKGMLSRGYWLNERHKPVIVGPMSTGGGVYEPCSIEESNQTDNDADKRLKEKLSQISDESDEEEIQVIPQSDQPKSTSVVIDDLLPPPKPPHTIPPPDPTQQPINVSNSPNIV